jgi:hypothetical protein
MAILSLGGFGGRRNRNMQNGPSLWERRARSKKSMILKRQNNPKDIRRRIITERQGKIKTTKITTGKGCSESKWLAVKSATS